MRNALIVVGIGAIILGVGWWYLSSSTEEAVEVIETPESRTPPTQQEATTADDSQGAVIGEENFATFQCDGGKSITAVFERDIVGLTLSDGRQLVLREAPSASGMRYLSNDTTIEFRGKGSEGSLIEGGSTTYANCKASL